MLIDAGNNNDGKGIVKYLKDRDPNSLNENEQAILDAYDNALYKIEENMNIKAVEAEEQIVDVGEI